MIAAAARIEAWLRAHPVIANIIYWAPLALISAHYARFIRFPDWLLVPFWIGTAFTVLRWTVFEQWVRPRITAEADRLVPRDDDHR